MTTTNKVADEEQLVEGSLPLRLTSIVVKGFGRGSTDLGIPTANLSRDGIKILKKSLANASFDDLPTDRISPSKIKIHSGIYWGFCRIGSNPAIFKTACSIGYNPYYGNKTKTVEPHLIAPMDSEHRHESSCGETLLGEFYDRPIRLTLVGYLRPELPFEGLEKLVAAIKQDILDAERLGDGNDLPTIDEKKWVASDDDISSPS